MIDKFILKYGKFSSTPFILCFSVILSAFSVWAIENTGIAERQITIMISIIACAGGMFIQFKIYERLKHLKDE